MVALRFGLNFYMETRPNACYSFWACIKKHQRFVALRFRLSFFLRPKLC